MTEQTALTLVERARQALAITQTEDELRAIAGRSADITAITNTDGREQVHSARMVLKTLRVDIQKRGKEARDNATKFSKAVIAEENKLIALISPEEDRLQKLQDGWDAAIEAEKQAKIDAELKRVADIQKRIAAIREFPDGLSLRSAADVQKKLEEAEAFAIDETFEEFAEAARSTLANAVLAVKNIHYERVQYETEQARIKAEREELEQLRAAQAKRDAEERARIAEEERQAKAARDAEAAKQAAELKAAREKQAAEAAAERKRIADEEAAAKAIRDAEAAKQAEELRLQREAQAKADADAKAIRDAEAKKLADERAEFERQQAAARKVKEEEERVKREQARLASIKKPADDELLGVLAHHYSVPVSKVIEWVLALDLSQPIAEAV